MKKYIHLILSLICMLAPLAQAVAQQDPKAFFVHRNDGDFNVFFLNQVDSIVYSKIDGDSILHDDFVTQEIWTPDTVVRIPIAAIDSVTFQIPDNIYTDDAKIMSDDLRDYILLVDSLDLYLSPSTPNDLWPAIGDKIITTERCEKMPGGFVGKVEKVENIGTFIKIECSKLEIEDVFIRYYSFFNIVGKNTDEEDKHKSTQRIIPEWPIDWTYDFGTFKINYSEGLTINDFFGFFDGSIGCNTICDLNIPDMRIVGCLIFEKEMGTYFSLSLGGTYKSDLEVSIYGSISKEGQVAQIPLGIIPLTPFVYLYGKCGVTMGISGTVSLGYKSNISGEYALSYTYSDRSPANLPAKATINVRNFNLEPNVISGDVAANIGVFIDAAVYWTRFKIGVVYEEGWQLSLGGSLGLSDFEKMKTDNGVYEIARDNIIWSVIPYTQKKIVIQSPILSYDKVFHEYGDPLLTAQIVPTFSNVDYTSDNALSYTFKADVDGDVFPSTPVGFRLVDEDGNILYNDYFQESYSKTPFKGECFSHYELSMNKPLEINKKYKLYPILNLFSNVEMLCAPMKEIELRVEPYTDGVDILSYDEVVCYGHVNDENNMADGCLVGIIFSETSDNVYNGKRISATLSNDNTFNAKLSNLEDDTRYYYCAYLKSDSDFYYGDIKSFKTPKIPDEAVDLGLSVLWAKYNVGASSEGEVGGLYGWADPTGTETSVDVVGDDGVTWNSSLYGGNNPPDNICGNSEYDIATRFWGDSWRLPSQAEMVELINNCTTEYEEVNGVPGLRFTSVINGNSIFMPGAGDRFGTEYRYGGEGFYWTGTLVPENNFNAYRMSFDRYGVYENNYPRYIGHSVRAVMPKESAKN